MVRSLHGHGLSREQGVNEVKAMYAVLFADVVAAKELLTITAVDTQFARRTLVRAYFALFEGLSFLLRQITLATDGGRFVILTPEESTMLQEKQRYLKLKDSLTQSLRYYAKCHRPTPYKPNHRSPGWQAMIEAIEVRDRVTHPKSASSVLITDAEHKQMLNAGLWWADSVRELLMLCEEADAHYGQYE